MTDRHKPDRNGKLTDAPDSGGMEDSPDGAKQGGTDAGQRDGIGKDSDDGDESRGHSGRRRCPICSKPTVARVRPFCSKRCADVDLNRWLSGRYTIPAVETDDPDAEDLSTRLGSSGCIQH